MKVVTLVFVQVCLKICFGILKKKKNRSGKMWLRIINLEKKIIFIKVGAFYKKDLIYFLWNFFVPHFV